MDNIISDNVRAADSVDKSLLSSYSLILEHLLYGLHKNKFKFNPFIYESFKVFCQNKTEITLNMDNINDFIEDKVFLNVIFGSNGFVKRSRWGYNNFSIPVNNENLPMRKFLESFNNVTSIKITKVEYGYDYYSFCLIRLLSLIEDTKIEKIEIGGWKGWLFTSWKVSSSSLIQTYKKKGFQIEYKYNKIYINKNK